MNFDKSHLSLIHAVKQIHPLCKSGLSLYPKTIFPRAPFYSHSFRCHELQEKQIHSVFTEQKNLEQRTIHLLLSSEQTFKRQA